MKKKIVKIPETMITYQFVHVNERGRINKKNDEIIGKIEACEIIRKVSPMTWKEIEILVDSLKENQNAVVFGRGIPLTITDKIVNQKNAFFIRGI